MKAIVTIVSAQGKSFNGKRTLYCELAYQEQKFTTRSIKGTCTWNQEFTFEQISPSEVVSIAVCRRSGDVIGETKLNFGHYTSEGDFEQTLDFQKSGQLLVRIKTLSSKNQKPLGKALSRGSSVQFIREKIQKYMGKQASNVEIGQDPIPINLDTQESTEKLEKSERRKRRRKIDSNHTSKSSPNISRRKVDPELRKLKKTSSREASHGDLIVPKVRKSKKSRNYTKSVEISGLDRDTLHLDINLAFPAPSEPSLVRGKNTSVVLQPLGAATDCKVFGRDLDDLMRSQAQTHPQLLVPAFLDVSGRIIRNRCCSATGIFRIRGKLKDVKTLKTQIENGEPIDEEKVDLHLVTTLLKAFLREMPVPVLLFENYTKYMEIGKTTPDEQPNHLRDLVMSLPENNYQVLKFLFELLYELSLQADETQMTAENLAKVISPNLMWKEEVDITDMSLIQDSLTGTSLTQVMIVNSDKVFTR